MTGTLPADAGELTNHIRDAIVTRWAGRPPAEVSAPPVAQECAEIALAVIEEVDADTAQAAQVVHDSTVKRMSAEQDRLRTERDEARAELGRLYHRLEKVWADGDQLSLRVIQLRAERDALSTLLRGMARRVAEHRRTSSQERESRRDWASETTALRAEVERLRARSADQATPTGGNFNEDDELVGDILVAFDAGQKVTTAAPPTTGGTPTSVTVPHGAITSDPWTLADLPDDAARICDHLTAHGLDTPHGQVLCVVEEAGELAAAYRRWAGLARRPGPWFDVVAELADVVLSAAVLAARLRIDLTQAIADKLNVINTRGWRERSDDDTEPDEGTCPECRCARPVHKSWCSEPLPISEGGEDR